MKIFLFIDSLGSGGAQRQLVNIACNLSDRGHKVEVGLYNSSSNFFEKRLKDNKIKIHNCSKDTKNKIDQIICIYFLIYNGKYDIAMSFLDTPNLIMEIISKFIRKTVFVVSERSSYLGFHNLRLFLLKGCFRGLFHSFADHVITNSITQKKWLLLKYRYLTNKVTCIYNGYQIDEFKVKPARSFNKRQLKLLAVGRTSPEKNIINLIHGLNLFFKENNWMPTITWVGRRDNSSPFFEECNKRIDDLLDSTPLVKSNWDWAGESSDVSSFYQSHDCLVHPSIFEGLPNVVCEALISGMPVLASNVCDNGTLVKEGERGFLFDPQSPKEISSSISRCVNLSDKKYAEISRNCRKYSHDNLDLDTQVTKFEKLFHQLLAC